MSKEQILNECSAKARVSLVGKRIVEVRYLNDSEMELMGWYKRPVCFILNDGTLCVVSADDEGNDGGSLFQFTDDDYDVIPTLYP